MNDDDVKKDRDRIIAEDLARIEAMSDEDIDTDDIPEVLDWTNAVRGKLYRPVIEQQSTLRNNSGDAQEVKDRGHEPSVPQGG